MRFIEPRRVTPIEAEASECAAEGLEGSDPRPLHSRSCIRTDTPDGRTERPYVEEVAGVWSERRGELERRDASTRSISSKPDWMISSSAADERVRSTAPERDDESELGARACAAGRVSGGALEPYSSMGRPLWMGGEGSEVKRYWFSDHRNGDTLSGEIVQSGTLILRGMSPPPPDP